MFLYDCGGSTATSNMRLMSAWRRNPSESKMTQRNYWQESHVLLAVHLIICLDLCWAIAAVAVRYSSTTSARARFILFALFAVIFLGDLLVVRLLFARSLFVHLSARTSILDTPTICDSCSPIDSAVRSAWNAYDICMKSVHDRKLCGWRRPRRNRSNHKSPRRTHISSAEKSPLWLWAFNSTESKQPNIGEKNDAFSPRIWMINWRAQAKRAIKAHLSGISAYVLDSHSISTHGCVFRSTLYWGIDVIADIIHSIRNHKNYKCVCVCVWDIICINRKRSGWPV